MIIIKSEKYYKIKTKNGISIEVPKSTVKEINYLELSNYNEFNISCSEESDGFINVTIEGGEPFTDDIGNNFYEYSWSNGEISEDQRHQDEQLIQQITDKIINNIDEVFSNKENEILDN